MTRINFFSRFCTLAIVTFTAVGCMENLPTAAPVADNNQGGVGNPSGSNGNGGIVNPNDKNGGQQATANNLWVVDGDGFNNQKVYGVSGWGFSYNGTCSAGMSSSVAGEPSSIAIMFDGVHLGQYYWGASIGNMTTMVIGEKAYSAVQGVTTITRIDGPGGRIKGTFEGILANNWDASRQVQVKGSFDVPMRR